ncbi:hypothetical protein [Massilia yuzhufengensis]|uniref:Uncharacterized protein n=1 Tax=Massilia yuzhufengensis TaxID=1164594 RepID=A0A1I1EYJ1_9BURK|nr:hypothetical protein [Massilia yuzhufengensis]SFB89973.1 hypothetical protein SAMN05216204_102226 [Massilia yuzhufengensis]
MRRQLLSAALLAGLGVALPAAGASFTLFPVQEIEGMSPQARQARSLLDAGLMQRLFDGAAGREAQVALVRRFVASLAQAYPESLVHARQVADNRIGSGHQFVNNNDLQCKAAPSVAVADTYAVVLGITRASRYEVQRGDNVEVLVPVTLSLQFVRPSLAKVAYTVSETVYTPFRFSRAEYESGAMDGVMRAEVLKNIGAQVDTLVAEARAAFDPKATAVTLVERDGKFLVADRGVEAGFVKGEQVEARGADGKASIFDVLYADSGYAVLRAAMGEAARGDTLQFTFEGTGDDSRKPRLMPVAGAADAESNAVADIFGRAIGFKASFQLSPVDVHFAQTKALITRAANCVDWNKLPSMAEASGVRTDPPDFFLRFTPVSTPSVLLSGAGGTKAEERFHTLVSAQVVDRAGKVVFSELGDADHVIDRVKGSGLGLAQAREVALKNATGKLAQAFLANVRFAPRELRVARVDAERLWVEGMGGVPGQRPSFDVLHPLAARVHGKPALVDLDVAGGSLEPVGEGALVGLSYSATNPALPKPQRGDIVRVYDQQLPGVTRVVDCQDASYVGQNNVLDVAYAAPLVRHALYRSRKHAGHLGDPAFYSDANLLLKAGMFDAVLAPPAIPLCVQPGYVIREDAAQCEGEACKATVTMALVARFKSGGEVTKTVTSGLRTEFSGMPASSKAAYYGYKELGNGLSMQPDLLKKLDN